NTVSESVTTGTLALATTNNEASNSQVSGLATFGLGQLHSATRLTYQYEEERNDFFNTGVGLLKVASVPDLQAGDPTQLSAQSSIQTIRTLNGNVVQNFNYGDRYLLQLVGRRD